jgi:hypothetical protein
MTDERPRFEVRESELHGGSHLRSLVSVPAGEPLVAFSARAVHDRPARNTLQVSERVHIELTPSFLTYVNHACDANAHFDVARMELIALKPIAAGDEITFFYPATEWEIAEAFDCACAAPGCLGRITGASLLPAEVLLRHQLAPHVARLLEQRESARPERLDLAPHT